MSDESLGDRIRRLRVEAGIQQVDLAAAADVRPHTMWRYEAGQSRPRPETLERIAARLGVTSRYLLWGEEQPNPLPPESRLEIDDELVRADWAWIDEVAEEVSLTPEIVERLKKVNWTGGIAPSKETIRSYALDMKREEREQAMGRAPEPESKPAPGEKLPSGLTRREPRRGGGR